MLCTAPGPSRHGPTVQRLNDSSYCPDTSWQSVWGFNAFAFVELHSAYSYFVEASGLHENPRWAVQLLITFGFSSLLMVLVFLKTSLIHAKCQFLRCQALYLTTFCPLPVFFLSDQCFLQNLFLKEHTQIRPHMFSLYQLKRIAHHFLVAGSA